MSLRDHFHTLAMKAGLGFVASLLNSSIMDQNDLVKTNPM